MFLKQKIERFRPNKTTLFFLFEEILDMQVEMMALNKHFDLRK